MILSTLRFLWKNKKGMEIQMMGRLLLWLFLLLVLLGVVIVVRRKLEGSTGTFRFLSFLS